VDAIVESPNAEYATETREELLYNKGRFFLSLSSLCLSCFTLSLCLGFGYMLTMVQRNYWPMEISGSLSWRRLFERMRHIDKIG